MAKSLCCSPETPTTLLIHYTPIKMFLVLKIYIYIFYFLKKREVIEVVVDQGV